MREFVVDITRKGVAPVVQVTEFDSMSRFFTLILMDGGVPYEEPEGATYSVFYETQDGKGWYDTITLPDSTTRPAVTADGNEYTVEIAEAATTACGELALCITAPGGYQLTVAGIITRSADIPGYDGEEVENYYNVFITEMRENAARAENAADIAVAYGATVEVDEDAQQLNITHHSDTEGGVGWLFGSAVTNSASGAVAAIPDGANDVAVKSLIAEITPVQSGSGDPSPSNVRPITGRTGMTVTRAGKNLYNKDTVVNGYLNSSGTLVTNGAWRASDYISVNPSTTYTASGLSNGGNSTYVCTYNSSQEFVRSLLITASTNLTLTTSASEYYVRLSVRASENEYLTAQFEAGASATPYTPYTTPTEYPITWQTQAGTIYGGTLNVTTGVLTVDKALVVYSGASSESWNWQDGGTYKRVAIPLSDVRNPGGRVSVQSNAGTFRASGNDVGTIFASGTTLFYYPSASITSLADYKTWLASNNLQVVYPLATPTVIQLSPTEIRLLLGGNTIYTDAGNVSVEYIADTKLYIDNKIAELQALVLEN